MVGRDLLQNSGLILRGPLCRSGKRPLQRPQRRELGRELCGQVSPEWRHRCRSGPVLFAKSIREHFAKWTPFEVGHGPRYFHQASGFGLVRAYRSRVRTPKCWCIIHRYGAALGLAHALAEIGDSASGKPAQFRCLCFGLAMLRVPGHEIIQPEAQLGSILGRKFRDGLFDFFQGHQRRLAVRFRDLNPDGYTLGRSKP
jgi:hypothetical protein